MSLSACEFVLVNVCVLVFVSSFYVCGLLFMSKRNMERLSFTHSVFKFSLVAVAYPHEHNNAISRTYPSHTGATNIEIAQVTPIHNSITRLQITHLYLPELNVIKSCFPGHFLSFLCV